MYWRIKIMFLLLILCQAFHSLEEYVGKLWTVLAPAKFLSGFFSENLATGFLIVNIGLFAFGIFCWSITTMKNRISFQPLIWIWVWIEAFNGIGHLLLALNENSYFPGLITAPVLFLLSIYLAKELTVFNGSNASKTE